MSLTERLAHRIAHCGPMSTAEFMAACLHDPQFGYYAVRPAIGPQGDFITAPMISQMFGELIGAWVLEMWTQLDCPKPFRLIEIGPGDGVLMSDVLRTAKLLPAFVDAADLWLVETSRPLRKLQTSRLAALPCVPHWVDHLDQAPHGAPFILLANELLDCLPARQFIRRDKDWAERVIGLAGTDLVYGLIPAIEDLIPSSLRHEPVGSIVEVSSQQMALGDAVGRRLQDDAGAAIFIDYGRDRPQVGDTLQALQRHQKVDPLRTAGLADLTVHADFAAFTEAAVAAGAQASPIVSQGSFLKSLGLDQRAAALMRSRPDRQARIAREVDRLSGLDQMGALFKVVALHSRGLAPPGF